MTIEVITDHPIAVDSPDHLHPWGTMHDNHSNGAFNDKLRGLLTLDRMSVLDLGCAGGGFVKSLLDEGHFAVGIEGSDFSLRHNRAAWPHIPNNLFTADISEPFKLYRKPHGAEPYFRFEFGVVTMWDVIEHLRQDDLPALMQNIARHLMPSGLVIMSISPNEESPDGVPLHQTVQGERWWLRTFADLGWRNHPWLVEYFGDDMVRRQGDAPGSFYVVLTRANETPVLRDPWAAAAVAGGCAIDGGRSHQRPTTVNVGALR